MAEIPLQAVTALGTILTHGAAAAGDQAQVGNNKFLVVSNGSASSITVTIAVPGKHFTGVNNPSLAVAVAAGKIAVIPLLDAYGDPALNGQCAITYSSTTTVTRSVVSH